jgi:hypothetical protein
MLTLTLHHMLIPCYMIILLSSARAALNFVEVFYCTQYDPTVVRSDYRIFSIGKNGNLIDIYIYILFGK